MSKNPYGGPIPQHQEYAITGKANDETFNILQHDHKNKPNREAKRMHHRKAAVSDNKRAIPKHDGGFHHLPDHGPFESMAD